MLSVVQKMFFGPITREENRHLPDVNSRELVALTPLVILIFVIGLFPNLLLSQMSGAITRIRGDFDARISVSPGPRYYNGPIKLLPRKAEATPPPPVEAAEAKRFGRADLTFQVADAMQLPFADDIFDAVTVSFGLRNMRDYQAAITEMVRVVKPGGRWICLELTPFTTPVLGAAFNWYFTKIVPRIGGWMSGDGEAYHYLPTSVASFPDAEELLQLMRNAGLAAVEVQFLGFGTVALHSGIKPVPRRA